MAQSNKRAFATSTMDTGKLYGAMWADGEYSSHLSLGPDKKNAKRAILDTKWLVVVVLAPLALFAFLYAMESFRFHYDHPMLIWFIVLICLAPAMFFGYVSLTSQSSDWSKFLAQAFLLAWLAATVAGGMNYSSNMSKYYQITNLNAYVQVDPTKPGAATADAGMLVFAPGTRLELSKAMSVRVGQTFCVAPLSLPNVSSNVSVSYDYWAVGVECCSSTQPQVINECPGSPSSRAFSSGALRLLDTTNRPYFRMAVQQAEATYKIDAKTPIFLLFTEDPFAAVNLYRDTGIKTYWKGIGVFGVLMVFLVLTATLCFASLASKSHNSEYGVYKSLQANYPETVSAPQGHRMGLRQALDDDCEPLIL